MLRPHNFVACAGDLDLVVGWTWGSLNYIENTGAPAAPVFVQRTGSANPFDGVDVGSDCFPALGDIDGDGTLRRCPAIERLRPHFTFLAQATWTS